MNKVIIAIAAILVISSGIVPVMATPIDIVEHKNNQKKIFVSDGSNDFQLGNTVIGIGGDYTAIKYQLVRDFFDFTKSKQFTSIFGDISFDDSVKIKDQSGNLIVEVTTVKGKTAILNQVEYEQYLASLVSIAQPRDENAAPHLAGFNTVDADRVFFGNVEEQPIFVMSNTEIHILNGKATSQYVPVFFDGILIDIIDIGVGPKGEAHFEWIGFGGKIVSIPFGAYYEVTNEGQLINHGTGYQYVFRDLNDYEAFNNDDQEITSSGSTTAQRINLELYNTE